MWGQQGALMVGGQLLPGGTWKEPDIGEAGWSGGRHSQIWERGVHLF